MTGYEVSPRAPSSVSTFSGSRPAPSTWSRPPAAAAAASPAQMMALAPLTSQNTVWDQGAELLSEHLERIAEAIGTFTEGDQGFCTTEVEFAASDCPFRSRTIFFDEVLVLVEFHREADQLRYMSRIERGRSTLREGPTGLIDVSNGSAVAADDINGAFAKIGIFVDHSESLLRRENPFSSEPPLPTRTNGRTRSRPSA